MQTILIFLKTVLLILIASIITPIFAQDSPEYFYKDSIVRFDELDTNIYIVRNGRETLKEISQKVYLPSTLILPYDVYLKEWNDIVDENALLAEGTVIKLRQDVKMPTPKQINLAILQPFRDIHIVKYPYENLYTIFKKYKFAKMPIYGNNYYSYNLYLQTWNNIQYSDSYLPIGQIIKLTQEAIIPSEIAITKAFPIKRKLPFKYNNSRYNTYTERIKEGQIEVSMIGNTQSMAWEALKSKPNLTLLDIDMLGYEIDFATIAKLETLKVLKLDNNYLDSLPNSIFDLQQLTELWLGDNQLVDLPKQIGKLTNLKLIYLNDNFLTKLPKEIKNLKHLQGLYLERNNLDTLPIFISELAGLEYLTLQGNCLKAIAPQTKKMSKLKVLNLSNNPIHISEVDKTLLFMPQLEILYLGDLSLNKLPKSITSLKYLKKLYFKNYNRNRLRANHFSVLEQKKIKKLLPNCEIIFD